MVKHINVVLKISERCNLACTYCYFFQAGDDSWKNHSSVMKISVFDQVLHFLKDGCYNLGLKSISLIFHGGEPLLVKKQSFQEMCKSIRSSFVGLCDFSISIQTNGVLLDHEWINIFKEFDVSVGISIDGTKKNHDLYRIDKKGNATYDKVLEKIELLQSSNFEKFGTLTVLNEFLDGKELYRIYVDKIGLKGVSFLLPDYTHDTFNGKAVEYGKILIDIFDEWINDKNTNIEVRPTSALAFTLMGLSKKLTRGYLPDYSFSQTITISSDGDIAAEDALMATCDLHLKLDKKVNDISLFEALNYQIFKEIKTASNTLPDDCKTCCWQRICIGGQLVHRYSKEKKFNNRSVMCEGLKLYYFHIAAYLISVGHDRQKIESILLP